MDNLVASVKTISSREVAEMMEVRHSDLLEKIYKINKVLTNGNFRSFEYWIESTYTDAKCEKRKEYQVTKKGCEMLAHKSTGDKGIIFTARYIDKFDEMEKQLAIPKTYLEALLECARLEKERIELSEKLESQKPLVAVADVRMEKKGCFSITDATKSLGLKRGQITKWAREKGYLHKKLQEVNELGKEFFKVYSSDGVHNQIGINDIGMALINKNLQEIRTIR